MTANKPVKYLGEMLNDGRCLSLYRDDNGSYEEFDITSGSWKRSDDARDAFFGGSVVHNVEPEEAASIISTWKKNYEKYKNNHKN